MKRGLKSLEECSEVWMVEFANEFANHPKQQIYSEHTRYIDKLNILKLLMNGVGKETLLTSDPHDLVHSIYDTTDIINTKEMMYKIIGSVSHLQRCYC